MTALARLVLAALVAYVLIGVTYATNATVYYELFAKDPAALAPPWSSPMALLVWFVLPAALWPWSVAASRRSAPRRLKSIYPDNH